MTEDMLEFRFGRIEEAVNSLDRELHRLNDATAEQERLEMAQRVEELERRTDNFEAALLNALSGTKRLAAVLKCMVNERERD